MLKMCDENTSDIVAALSTDLRKVGYFDITLEKPFKIL